MFVHPHTEGLKIQRYMAENPSCAEAPKPNQIDTSKMDKEILFDNLTQVLYADKEQLRLILI